jgi:hypothetical protein
VAAGGVPGNLHGASKRVRKRAGREEVMPDMKEMMGIREVLQSVVARKHG